MISLKLKNIKLNISKGFLNLHKRKTANLKYKLFITIPLQNQKSYHNFSNRKIKKLKSNLNKRKKYCKKINSNN